MSKQAEILLDLLSSKTSEFMKNNIFSHKKNSTTNLKQFEQLQLLNLILNEVISNQEQL